jgi:hypothetical protein
MVIAALVCFTILLMAWLLVPDDPRTAAPVAAVPDVEPTPQLEAA